MTDTPPTLRPGARQIADRLLRSLLAMSRSADPCFTSDGAAPDGTYPYGTVADAYRTALSRIPGVRYMDVWNIYKRTVDGGESLGAVLADMVRNEQVRRSGAQLRTEIRMSVGSMVIAAEMIPANGGAPRLRLTVDEELDDWDSTADLGASEVRRLHAGLLDWLRAHDPAYREPIGFRDLAASFDIIGEATDAWQAGTLTAEEALTRVVEQVGVYEKPLAPDRS
ncbi:hypothetical protein [Actinomadura nitritigenes]|uniref:hypothetical protein n=1 Tax=Actinomadura nitritigenes TaxID=134602 RepID=UPI003D917B6B